MTRVLVLDSENKNALAAIRSLGRHGLTVISGSSRRLTRGSLSRFSSGRVIYPSPEDEDAFVSSIIKSAETLGIDVVLPIGDATTRAASKHKAVIAQHAAVPVADWTAMQIASSKEETVAFAMRQGVQVPRTYDDKGAVKQFPVVVKRSLGAGGVRYVNDAAELEHVDSDGAVIQDFIPGDGYGFFALFDRGRERAIFMHRRIREYPVTGGASTAAESAYDGMLRELGLRLLRALDWHGVAMVEFKKDARDSQYKLMEINPKFWGSLDLSIASGVDFPWLTVKMALGDLENEVTDYGVGVRFRWVFDDFMHLAARPTAFPDFIRDFRHGVQDDLYRDDLKPAVFDAAKTITAVVGRAATGRLRRPHGEPRRSD
jgi:predicted ATP-grasp superfamily ATP-dependent carboligase